MGRKDLLRALGTEFTGDLGWFHKYFTLQCWSAPYPKPNFRKGWRIYNGNSG